jgi:ketosteroid isomerase-like protein
MTHERTDVERELRAMLERAQAAWQDADVDGWLALFAPDAKFFVPGATTVSGDHDAGSIRAVLPQLMRAGGEDSGMSVIDSFLSANGAVALADQQVRRGEATHHYHQMMLYEIRPEAADRFAFWWLLIHEYDAFAAAWA